MEINALGKANHHKIQIKHFLSHLIDYRCILFIKRRLPYSRVSYRNLYHVKNSVSLVFSYVPNQKKCQNGGDPRYNDDESKGYERLK